MKLLHCPVVLLPGKTELQFSKLLSKRLDLLAVGFVLYYNIAYKLGEGFEVSRFHPESRHLRNAKPERTGGRKTFFARGGLIVDDYVVFFEAFGQAIANPSPTHDENPFELLFALVEHFQVVDQGGIRCYEIDDLFDLNQVALLPNKGLTSHHCCNRKRSNPGQSNQGACSDALVEFVDIYPTLLELCNLPMPEKLEGLIMKPLLDNPARQWKKAAFSQYPRHRTGNRHKNHGDIMGYTIRTKDFRYVEWRQWETRKVVARELYDHRIDKQEMVNIVEQEQYSDNVKELSKLLNSGWKASLPPKV